jgi:PAS domain S-box-containing protein
VCVATVVGMTAYSRNMEHWVEHTTTVYQTTRSGLLDLTGSPSGRQATPSATNPERAIARFDSVGDLTADNAMQQARMRSIRELAGQWTRAGRAGTAVAPGLADATESKVREFLAEEQRLYRVRSDRFHEAQTATAVTVAIELAFVALLIVVYSRRIARHVAAANEQQDRLEEQATELEEQALELEVSNHELRETLKRLEIERESAAKHERRGERTAALLNASLDSAPAAFALVDHDLRYVQVNPRWAELTGVAPAAHIGRRFDDVSFSKDALGPALDVVARIGNDSLAPVNVSLSGHRASDEKSDLRHWLLSAAPVSETKDSAGGVAIALLDVSDHTRTTNQLLHVQKMEAIGRLAGGIAHDFNNSLAVINAYASMLTLSHNLDDTDHGRVDEIIEAVQRAAGLTQQLLAFGRRQITQPRRIDVSDVVRGMVPVLTRLIPASIHLETQIGDRQDEVLIDTSQLEQIVLNLVNNAIHAMPDGGHLAIATETVALDDGYAGSHMAVIPGPYVMFTISDSGIGMDETTMSRIFEPFFTTKEAGKGTGLGLASVYAIVKDAGGHTWVYSEPGKGTEFKVYLPIVAGTTQAAEERAEAHTLHREDFAKLLLVEDDEKLRPAVARLLEQAGYTIVEASNGDSALARLREHGETFDLVITDLVMPGLSGRELSEIIADRYPTLRVLFTSGYTDDGVVRRGMIERGYPFIQKPFTRDQLLGAIDQALTAA